MSTLGISSTSLDDLTPEVREKANEFIVRCRLASIYITITSTYRSQERQTYLYEQGKTEAAISDHTKGNAFDFVPDGLKKRPINGEATDPDDIALFTKCGIIAESIGLRWGGNFNIKDHVHCDNGVPSPKPYYSVAKSGSTQIPGTQSLDNSVTFIDPAKTQKFNENYSVLENFSIGNAGNAVTDFNESTKDMSGKNILGMKRTNKFVSKIIAGREAAAKLPAMVRVKT
jgi:peptidoglycan L-alanyl-D-glutamate endopeptidase CwlK